MYCCQHTHTYIHSRFTALWVVWDNLGELVPEESYTHSVTHTSSIIPCLLHPSITIYGILSVQFTCLTVFFHNLSRSFLYLPLRLAPSSTSYSIHFFIQSLSSFRNTCPCHRNLVCCSTEIMSPNPGLSQPFTWKCHLIFLSYGPGLTSMQHTTLHTTAVQYPSHYINATSAL